MQESVGECGKTQKSIGNCGRVQESVGNGRAWERVGEHKRMNKQENGQKWRSEILVFFKIRFQMNKISIIS